MPDTQTDTQTVPLTADDANAIANALTDAAAAIDHFLDAQWDTIDRAPYDLLLGLAKLLLRTAVTVRTAAVDMQLAQMTETAQTLKSVTADARQALGTLQSVSTALVLASALLQMGAALIAHDPAALGRAANALREALP